MQLVLGSCFVHIKYLSLYKVIRYYTLSLSKEKVC